MSRWYKDEKGYNHEIMLCHKCGAIHDIQFSMFNLLLYPLFKNPYQTVGYMEFMVFIVDVMDKVKTTGLTVFQIVERDYSFNNVVASYMHEFINIVVKNNNQIEDKLTSCFPDGVIYD